jgi:hypothetical protein
MLVLQGFQLPVESVVLGVGDLRRIIYVVTPVVVTDLLAQILYPNPNVHASGHAGIIRTDAHAPKRSLFVSVFTDTVYADTAEVVEGECEQVKAW